MDHVQYQNQITVCVEGNIASGKSSFIKGIGSEYQDFMVLDEPVSKWTNCNGANLLQLMYEDPKKWAMCFQSYVMLTMLDNHTMEFDSSKRVKIIERSIFSAQYCFVENLKRQHCLTEAECLVLGEWFEFAKTHLPINPDLIVYLRTSPSVVFDRCTKRDRKEERKLTLEYLEAIHNLHEEWLIYQKEYFPPCRVWVVDANVDEKTMNHNKVLLRQKLCEIVPSCHHN